MKIPNKSTLIATKGAERKSENSATERENVIHVRIISAALRMIRNAIKNLDIKWGFPQERNCKNLPFSSKTLGAHCKNKKPKTLNKNTDPKGTNSERNDRSRIKKSPEKT
jgi:hypothetical protein